MIATWEESRKLAVSDLDDGDAMARLRARVTRDIDAARDAVELVADGRTSYHADRTYRLLAAAVEGTDVRPIDPAVRDQFLAEMRLARMSVTDAFEHLASLEPRLRDLPALQARQPPPKRGISFGPGKPELVGVWAESPHQILNTDLAAEVVHTYLRVTQNGTRLDTDPTPFVERLFRTHNASFVLFGGDPRPRAHN